MLEYGEREWEIEQIIERNKKGAKIPIPAWYKEKTGVPDELRWFWQAFWELDTCRAYSEGLPQHIPWTAAFAYARYHEIDFDYLWHLIVTLDSEYVRFHADKRKEQVDDLKSKSNSQKPNRSVKHGRR